MGVSFWRIGSLVLLALLAWGCDSAGGKPAATRPASAPATRPKGPPKPLEETLTVDLDRCIGTIGHRANGLTRALQELEPPEATVAPLRPALFCQPAGQSGAKYRAELVASRAAKLGGVVQAVLGDSVPFDGRFPGEKGKWEKWDQGVANLVGDAKASGGIAQWDVWSEPDRRESWKGSRDDYFRCWHHTVSLIRSIDPAAQIVGPSISRFDGGWLEGFMKDAKDFGVLPTMISWHETGGKPEVVAHVNQFEENCWQDGLGFRRFCINRTVGRAQSLSAAVPVFYLAELERARVEFAARGHYGEHGYQVGSLLTPDFRPRAAWWTYRMYVELKGEMPKVSGSMAMDGLAAYDAPARTLRILAGRDWARSGKKREEKPAFGPATLKLQHVPGTTVHIALRRIPATGDKPCEGMSPEMEADCPVNGASHEALVPLGTLEDGAAAWIEVRLSSQPTMKRSADDLPSAFDTRLKN